MGLGWVQPGGGGSGTVSLIQSGPDETVSVTSGAGPTTTLENIWSPPWVPVALNTGLLVTSTAPGVSPFAGSQEFVVLGTVGDPITLDPGSYELRATVWVEVGANNTQWWVEVFQEGDPFSDLSGIGPASQPMGLSGAQGTFVATFEFVEPIQRTTYFTLNVARGGGTDDVTYRYGQLGLWRVG